MVAVVCSNSLEVFTRKIRMLGRHFVVFVHIIEVLIDCFKGLFRCPSQAVTAVLWYMATMWSFGVTERDNL